MKKCIFLIPMLMLVLFSHAQQSKITGKVSRKSNNEPLQGVTVQTKNNTIATAADGSFSIEALVGETIIFSFVGMNSQLIKVTGRNQNLNLLMEETTAGLNEVVVVGYSSQRKKDLTGAIAVVDLTAVKNNSSGNTMQALQGRVAGLYIEKDGSPNGSNTRILIRGANTLGNNDPLYIIDGIATTRPEVFQNMDPSTIASVQVLKDASAESIYGARASNGVIIV